MSESFWSAIKISIISLINKMLRAPPATSRSSLFQRRRAVACSCQSDKSLFVFGLGYTTLGLVRQAEAQQQWCVGRFASAKWPGMGAAVPRSLSMSKHAVPYTAPRRFRVVSTSRRPDRLLAFETQAHSIVRFDPAADGGTLGCGALLPASHLMARLSKACMS
jgi:hypothetical protein